MAKSTADTGLADFHAEAAPFLRAGEADFVVVFRVAQGFVETLAGESERIEIVRPFAGFVDAFQHVVARIVIDRVETGVQQFVEHMAVGEFRGIVVVGLGGEKHVCVAAAGALHRPAPEFHGHHVRHVRAEAIHAHRLPVGEDLIHRAPGFRHLGRRRRPGRADARCRGRG